MTNFEDQKDLMTSTFEKFNGEQIHSHTNYGFYKFRFSDKEVANKAFEEYNNLGGHSAREDNEITVFIKKEKDSVIEELKKLEVKLYALRAAIFIYWLTAVFSLLMFCYFFPYNAIAIMTGIIVYSHIERYLK